MTERSNVISIDIGGSSCKIGLVNSAGEVVDFIRFDTAEVRDWGPEGFVERLEPLVKESSVEGVALGVPAMVDWDPNHVRGTCEEVPWLEDASSQGLLRDELRRPVLLMNDVEALLVGEWFWGELKGLNSGVVLSLGRSMGSALLWNGTPQQGRRGSIMDLEHLSLDTYGERLDNYPPGSSWTWLSGLDPERIVLAGGLTKSQESWLPNVDEKMDEYIVEEFKGVPSVTLSQLRDEDVTKGPAAFWDWVNSSE